MSKYKNWEEFAGSGESELLNTVLTFDSIFKGVLSYSGVLDGKKVYCTVSEIYVCDYEYNKTELVSEVTQAEYVYLTVDGKLILSW